MRGSPREGEGKVNNGRLSRAAELCSVYGEGVRRGTEEPGYRYERS